MNFFPYMKPDGRTGTTDERFTGEHTELRRSHHEPSARSVERPQIDLIGESVALGPLEAELLSRYQTWLEDQNSDLDEPVVEPLEDDVENLFEYTDDLFEDLDDIYFTVYEMNSWRPIGGAALTEIDYEQEVAEFSIVIGEHDCRGKGYGTESTRLVLDYAFNALGLSNVMLRVVEHNYSARSAFERAGFREFSRRRSCHLEGARLWDEIYMGCLAGDFNSEMGIRIQMPENLNA